MSQPNPQLLFQQATGFHQRGQLAEAERLYLQLIAGLPFTFEPRHMLGVLRLQQGRHAEALETIGGALKINPGNADALGNYGNVLKCLGRAEDAVTAYDKAVAIKPDFAGALYNRALLLQELKRNEDALAGYGKVLALNPRFFEALYNRGILLIGLGRKLEQPRPRPLCVGLQI